jgi:uncharacterized protein (TIGR03000 family)
MKRNIIMGALALAAICAFTTPASAQRYRGGYGGYRGGYGGYNRGYSGYNRGYDGYRGYGGYGGYRGGYGYGYGYGYGTGVGYGVGLSSGIILGNALGGYGYGYSGYAPTYSGYSGYAPTYSGTSGYNYVPSTTYVNPGILSAANPPVDSSRESLYYAPETLDNTARLRILLPANAKVWVGGHETGQSGSDREFTSPPLTPGKAYTYEVKARWMVSGEPREQTRKVTVHANQTTTVDFGRVAEIDK